jgi:hypothetical protein
VVLPGTVNRVLPLLERRHRASVPKSHARRPSLSVPQKIARPDRHHSSVYVRNPPRSPQDNQYLAQERFHARGPQSPSGGPQCSQGPHPIVPALIRAQSEPASLPAGVLNLLQSIPPKEQIGFSQKQPADFCVTSDHPATTAIMKTQFG